ncbi:MAG: hypothetical protein ABIJ33_00380 [Patescibacteria group bacterium]
MDAFASKLKNEIEKLGNEKLAIEKKIRALNSAYETYLGDGAGNIENKELPKKGKEVKVDIMERVLREAGKPLHYQEIVKLVEQEGYSFTGKDHVGPITATLSRSKRFKSVGEGYYTLTASDENSRLFQDE